VIVFFRVLMFLVLVTARTPSGSSRGSARECTGGRELVIYRRM
jgi:hypothetical protein